MLELTSEAASEVNRLISLRGFPPETGVRVVPDQRNPAKCRVEFDMPESDGTQWVGVSRGLTILVDNRDALWMRASILDFREGEFRLAAGLPSASRVACERENRA